jgi:hypothetical protein
MYTHTYIHTYTYIHIYRQVHYVFAQILNAPLTILVATPEIAQLALGVARHSKRLVAQLRITKAVYDPHLREVCTSINRSLLPL